MEDLILHQHITTVITTDVETKRKKLRVLLCGTSHSSLLCHTWPYQLLDHDGISFWMHPERVNTGVNSITFVFSVCVDKGFSWHVESLPSRGRDAQTPPSLIIRNVEGEGGRGKKGNGFLAVLWKDGSARGQFWTAFRLFSISTWQKLAAMNNRVNRVWFFFSAYGICTKQCLTQQPDHNLW